MKLTPELVSKNGKLSGIGACQSKPLLKQTKSEKYEEICLEQESF